MVRLLTKDATVTPLPPDSLGSSRAGIHGLGWIFAFLLVTLAIVGGLARLGSASASVAGSRPARTVRSAPAVEQTRAAWPAQRAQLAPTASHKPRKRRTAAAVPAYCQSGGTRLWSHLAACGWPGESTTGPVLADCHDRQLVQRGNGVTPIVLASRNEVVSCAYLRGPVEIKATGVTIRNSTVAVTSGAMVRGNAAIIIAAGASATISHVAIDGRDKVHACIWHRGVRLKVTAVNCRRVHDAIFAWAVNGSAAGGDNYSIMNSYFHAFTKPTAHGHDDGFQTEGSSHGLIRHDTFRMPAGATSAIAIWDSRRSSSDIAVTKNLIAGGGFAVYAEDYNPDDSAPEGSSATGGNSVTDIWFDDNSFSTAASGCVGKYGVWFTRPGWQPYEGGPTDGWHRLDNLVLETGENIDNANPQDDSEPCG
jgi:hypothetical protein